MRFTANVGAGGSFDPAVTLSAGAPTPVWTVTDGGGTAVYNTAGITHIQSGAGTLVATLGPVSLYPYITAMDAATDGLLGTLDAGWLRRMPNLQQLRVGGNSFLICRWTLADLPASMTYLSTHWTSSVITGALADLPAGMTNLFAYNTSSAITGGATPMAARGVLDIQLHNTAMSQDAVDSIVLGRLYVDRALFTAATPNLSIGGTNAAPSGTYADEDPPVTGKGAIYELVVDPEAEGFRKWTVTYSA